MMMRSLVSSLLVTITLAGAVRAENMVEPQAQTAAEAFLGICLNDSFSPENVVTLAERRGWERLRSAVLDTFLSGPKLENRHGFIAKTQDVQMVVMTAQMTSAEGGAFDICSILFGDVRAEKFISVLEYNQPLKVISDKTGPRGRARVYLPLAAKGALNEMAGIEQSITIENNPKNEGGMRVNLRQSSS
jgi:hypothetical protein